MSLAAISSVGPPTTVVVAVAVASGTEGVRPRRLFPATEWDVATGIGPPPVKGAGPAPRTRHHDPRPAASAASGKDTNQTSPRACVLYLVRQIYLRRTEGGDDDTSSTFRRDETIEFVPKLGEAAPIGRAPVRPRGRSSSSSINNHSISSKQQRSSSITNSPDPSIIISDAAEPTAAGSRGANCVVMTNLLRRGGPFGGHDHVARGTSERAAPIYYEHHNLDV